MQRYGLHVHSKIDDENPGQTKYPRGSVIAWSAVLFIAFGAVVIWVAPKLLLDDWLPQLDATERGKLMGAAAQIVLLTLGGAIAVIGVALSLARHGQELTAAERDRVRAELQRRAHDLDREKEEQRRLEVAVQRKADDERQLRARFVTAVELLSSAEASIKRTAGLYALAALADDWHGIGRADEAQVCVDVLCGYLRAPLGAGQTGTPPAEREARRTGYQLINDHLGADVTGAVRWSGLVIDLSGAYIDFPVELAKIRVEGSTILRLNGVKVTGDGQLRFRGAIFQDDASLSLDDASISDNGRLIFQGATVDGASRLSMSFVSVQGRGRLVVARMRASGTSVIRIDDLTLLDRAEMLLYRSTFADNASLSFFSPSLTSHARLTLERVTATEHGHVRLQRPIIDSEGLVRFTRGLDVVPDGHVVSDHQTVLSAKNFRDARWEIRQEDGKTRLREAHGPSESGESESTSSDRA